MSYAQRDYKNITMGYPNPKYNVAQIGCFLTAFSNLLEAFGEGEEPPHLNHLFVTTKSYLDIDDGIFDDLGWGSISAIKPHVVVSRTGTGAPSHNNSIVKFTGIGTFGTHFSKVADVRQGTIVDSIDGVIKSWNVYGGPKAFAEYVNNKPIAVNPVVISPTPTPSGETLVLPPVPSWAVYHLNTPGRKGTSDQVGTLSPAKYGGLSYAVLGHPMPNFVTIATQMFGTVNIYVGPGTNASIVPSMAPAPTPTPPPAPEPVVASEPIPVSPPPVVITVVPTPEEKEEVIIAEPEKDETESVNVIDLSNPDAWKASFKINFAGKYTALASTKIHDYDDTKAPEHQLVRYRTYDIAGTFEKSGKKYYRTVASDKAGNWYGIPEICLTPYDQEDDESDDYKFGPELMEYIGNKSNKKKIIKTAGTVDGKIRKFINAIKGIFKTNKKDKK